MIEISDQEFEDIPIETNEETIERLSTELAEASREARSNWDALCLLMKICKERGFDPFPGEGLGLAKSPYEMTKAELFEANKQTTERIAKNRHALNGAESIPMPTPEEEEERVTAQYAEGKLGQTKISLFKLLEAARENGGTVTLEKVKEILGVQNG